MITRELDCAGLEVTEEDHDLQRSVTEAPDVTGRLAVEEDEKGVYVRCMLGDEALSVMSAPDGLSRYR